MLQMVKDYLKITWDDDQNLTRIIDSARASINEMMGVELDYDEPGQAQDLFMNRCRYDYNNALEYFEQNFQADILRLQLQVGARELNTDGDS